MDYIDMPVDVLAERLERCVEDRNSVLAQRDDLLAACEAACALLQALRFDGVISPLYALPSPVRHHYQETEALLRSVIAKAKGK